MIDLVPKVKRVDAIQTFVSQETPILTDPSTATVRQRYGLFSYTIGTGGPSVMALLEHTLAPMLIGRDPDRIEGIWRDLLFATHATAVGRNHVASAGRDRHGALGSALPQARSAALECRRRIARKSAALHHRGRLVASGNAGAGR